MLHFLAILQISLHDISIHAKPDTPIFWTQKTTRVEASIPPMEPIKNGAKISIEIATQKLKLRKTM